MFIFEVWDDSNEGKEDLIATCTFNDLEKAKEYARKIITQDEEAGKNYAYFITDEDEEVYDIWE
ncbi:hypothetical protein [Desulfosporosinus sp. FKA]|uniref:hypothetical protein n=1 Tax=Desulfosporosinus sp. FKA TaxID=1969834 RepID=UPI000B49FE58|nr:hypothetical protein [Desulfosporosinus sp. FKA]